MVGPYGGEIVEMRTYMIDLVIHFQVFKKCGIKETDAVIYPTEEEKQIDRHTIFC